MNAWGIPDWLEAEVRARDTRCVYCGIRMLEIIPPRGPRKAAATWEHIINDETIVTRENIVRCCAACNSSKGTKPLAAWIESQYCKTQGITKDTGSSAKCVCAFRGLAWHLGKREANAPGDPRKSAGLKGKLATLVAFGDP